MHTRVPRPSRLRRALAKIGAGLGLGVVFVSGVAGSALLHLNTPVTRRVGQTVTNDLLASLFQGRIVVGDIEALGLQGLRVRNLVIHEPRGGQVVDASGVAASVDVLRIVQSALFGTGDLEVAVQSIRVDHVDVLVEASPDGGVTLGQAFEAKPSGKPDTEPPQPSRPTRVELPNIEVGHIWAHGPIAPGQLLDSEVTDMHAGVLVTSDGVSLDLDRTHLVERTLLPGNLPGSRASLAVDVAAHVWLGDTVALSAAVAGRVGALELSLEGAMDDDRVSGTVNVPHVTPEELSSLVPDHPLTQPVSLEVQVGGGLNELIDGVLQVNTWPEDALGAQVDVDAQVDLGASTAEAEVGIEAFDLQLVGADLPQTQLDAHAKVRAGFSDLWAILDVRTEPTTLSAQPIPAADLHAVYAHEEINGTLTAHEPGMPVEGRFTVLPQNVVSFLVETEAPSLAAVPRLGGLVQGRAKIRVEGTASGESVDVRLRGNLGGIGAAGAVSLGGATVEGRLSGPFDKLQVDARVAGRGLQAGGMAFDTVRVEARGGLMTPTVSARVTSGDDAIAARANLSATEMSARRVELSVRRGGEEFHGKIARVGQTPTGLQVENIHIEGDEIGSLKGGLALRGNDIIGGLRAENLDLGRISQMVGVPVKVGGLANLDLALDRDAAGKPAGKLNLELENGAFASVSGVSAHFTATIADEELLADGLLRLIGDEMVPARERPPVGTTKPAPGALGSPDELHCGGSIAGIRISRGRGKVTGSLLEARTWEGLTGSVEIATDRTDLGCVAEAFPLVQAWVSDVRGKLHAHAAIARAAGERFPTLSKLVVNTTGLQVAGPRGFFEDEEQAPWASRFINGQVEVSLDGKTGRAQTGVIIHDGDTLLDVGVRADLDLAALLDRPEDRWATLEKTPFWARVQLPRRRLGTFRRRLPTPFNESVPAMTGEIQVDALAKGTLLTPSLTVRAQGYQVSYGSRRVAGSERFAFPLDLDLLTTYQTEQLALDAHIAKGKARIATLHGSASVPLALILGDEAAKAGGAGKAAPRITGGLLARITKAPMSELPLLGDMGIGGELNGEITLTGLGENPAVNVQLDVPDLRIGEDLAFDRTSVSFKIQPQGAAQQDGPPPGKSLPEKPTPADLTRSATDGVADKAVARVELVTKDGGQFYLDGYAGVRWEDKLIPGLDTTRPSDVVVRAQRFRLAAAQPAVAGVLSRIDGYLDGDLHLGKALTDGVELDKLEANMEVTQGVIHVPALGQELQDLKLRITAKDGKLSVSDLSTNAMTGRITGGGEVRLDGLKLLGAKGGIRIDKGEEIPLTIEGVPLGSVRAEVEVTAEQKQKELVVQVSVPTFNLHLPSIAPRSVQGLDANPDVSLSHQLGPEEEEESSSGGSRTVLQVQLGKITVDGSGLDLALTSPKNALPTVVLDGETKVSGDIVMTQGSFEGFGKRLEVERALVRLRPEDTGNPYVNAVAYWDAPDGTRVFIEYSGDLLPITDDKLRIRSEPPLSESEILSKLLFGSGADTSSSSSTESGGAGGVAADVGGSIASSQVNAIIQGLTPLRGLSTNFGTNAQGGLKTSVAYELDRNLTASASFEEASRKSGAGAGTSTTSAGAPGGSANQRSSRTELSVDWRFKRNWTLRGIVGVGGTQPSSGILDVLWQYRY
ncbi:translocation/assembly module TamB domain-containing protein [Chondromyces crocatus]|nr:translocation/assembly module TamB domain-containing protein [Chondromyces crocatus]